MNTQELWNGFIEYFPVFKWIVGGLLTVIAVLGGYIWRKQNIRIKELEEEVEQLARASVRHVTHEDLEEFRHDVDRKFDGIRQELHSHNAAVNSKLDKLLWHIINEKD